MFGYKTRNLVVMDGSSKMVLNEIIDMIMDVNQKSYGQCGIRCRKLDKDHPTMMVVLFNTTNELFDKLREKIEEKFPALCTFDAVV